MYANKFQELIDKYLTNAILAEEQEQLFDMIERKEYRADLEKVVKEARINATEAALQTQRRK